MKESLRHFQRILLMLFVISNLIYGQTGKIAGVVIENGSENPITGANIFLNEIMNGASTDENGEFFILNIPPGKYTLNVQMIGYTDYVVKDVRVSVNRTVYINAELTPSIIEGEVIVVKADKITSKKDQTSSVRNISSEQLEVLPVENVQAVINMQAGVVDGHFRGGRSNEVSFMIDGVQVVDSYSGESNSVTLETDVIAEVEVITGTFNAEYGRAMSGIVNQITKEGSKEFRGSFSSNLANYITSNDNIFSGLKNSEFDRQKDYKFQLTGPIWSNKLTFLLNTRSRNNNGYLNGIKRFNVDDFNTYPNDDPSSWVISNTGNGKFNNMDFSNLDSYTAKITSYFLKHLKMSLLYTRNDEEWGDYNHSFKYNPTGVGTNYKQSDMYSFSANHLLSESMFYDLNISYVDNFYGWYLFKNPESAKYIHDIYLNNNGPSFFTGGQQKSHEKRTTTDINYKFDLTWQVNKRHLFKTGILFTQHEIDHTWHSIQNDFLNREEDQNAFYFDAETRKYIFPNYAAVVYPNTSIYTDKYIVKPFEFSAYLQDKMEFDKMVVNLGLRYDYFDPQTIYPSQRRNPANQLSYEDNELMSTYPNVKAQSQISPRLGLSYQLGDVAVLHFSYGHFFQMPAMYAMYQNNSFQIPPTNYETTMGNSQLEAQQTVQYEFGLWQELMPDMGFEIVVFYRDIYKLLSTKIITTFNAIKYGLYTNKDYGNVKGLELKWDYRVNDFFANVNYTLQYTRGNADNPTQTFNRLGESRDPIPTLIPMSWDQRNTLNATIGYHSGDYGITFTGYYNSGTPFSWTPIDINQRADISFLPNNSYQRETYTIDLNGFYKLYTFEEISIKLNLSIYNLFDRLNDNWVYSKTGRAYTDVILDTDRSGHISNFNTYDDWIKDPSMYSAPRLIKTGLTISF